MIEVSILTDYGLVRPREAWVRQPPGLEPGHYKERAALVPDAR